jgi:hypothetical protein
MTEQEIVEAVTARLLQRYVVRPLAETYTMFRFCVYDQFEARSVYQSHLKYHADEYCIALNGRP